MKKGWKQKKVNERAWGLQFTRWYLIAPSGNKYHFFRGCHFSTIWVPMTYDALLVQGKDELKEIRRSGKTVTHMFTDDHGNDRSYEKPIYDEYRQALNYIYSIEESGGFKEQNKMNKWLDQNKEMQRLFAQPKPAVSYLSTL